MIVTKTQLPGLLVIEPTFFGDQRGFFAELWNQERFAQAGISEPFVQNNLSRSARGVLRGLHFQNPHAQGKLVTVLEGDVFDVAVDIRLHSPTFGQWFGCILSAENKRQIYVPPGFAHGFQVLSPSALFLYFCTQTYHPKNEHTILWNDPEIGIEWPITVPPLLSEKDAHAPTLSQISPQFLPLVSPVNKGIHDK